MKPIHLGTALLAITLAGCTSMSGLSGSSSYACKAPEGVACESVSGTYANAVQNNLPSQRRRITNPVSSSVVPPPRAASASANSPPVLGLPPTPVALRSSPRILRLWFKPWEDADHDLYDQGYVYVQVDAGRWQIDHVQRQIRDAYAPIKAPPRAADAKDGAPLPNVPKDVPRPPARTEMPGLPRPAGSDTNADPRSSTSND